MKKKLKSLFLEFFFSLDTKHFLRNSFFKLIFFRHDRPLPTRAVNLMVNNLIHDNLMVRKCAIFVVGNILKQQKRPHKKVQIDTKGDNPSVPGDRPANFWLCYDPQKAPKSESDWNEPRYVHKTHYGYYKWPPKMEVYAASSEQPQLQR